VYARRIGSSGSVYWTTDGVAVCTATGSQMVRTLVSDGSLGAIIAWSDARSGTTDIYAQRITGSGFVQWAADGIPICTASGSQSNVVGGSDGNGGAILAWTDARAGQDDIYAQKVDFYGSTGWTYDGVPVCTQGSQQYSINLVVSPTGNTVLSWSDARLGTYNIFAQILDQTGTRMSVPDGVQLSPGTFGCEHNVICADDEGGAVTAWNTTSTYAVMAQRIERNGFWGYPAPMIADVRDVPGDQGGSVDLAWYASRLDPWPDMAIDRYTVWRAISHPDAMLLASSGARIIDSVEELASPDKETPSIMAVEDGAPPVRDGDVIRRETVGATTYFWKMLSTIDAYYLDSYSEVAETLFDSTGVSDEHHYFQVIAHSTVPSMFWISETDSGYSVDNLAPAIPLGIMGEQSYTPEGLSISWDPNLENDLSHYNIYRGLTGSFEPGPGNLLTSVPDTVTFDGTWSWDAGYYYKLAAVDIHGNESGYALLAPSGVTGDDVPDTPLATYLGQNYPNPFNPVTTIAFGLSRASHVSLKVYDSAGRLVRVVLDEDRAPGHYKVAWNGLNSRGAPVSSGIYYYRLVSQTFDETRKMVMLR
ncbi:MAG TPA: FlgD immunoglobulin-like domain containing protein, partial [Candidatus Krumholzibacterium sp.]|nr:FlgD immunoglobulin-like domain containing protein [Candidatus Krumholzibacterium sp.]